MEVKTGVEKDFYGKIYSERFFKGILLPLDVSLH